MKIDVHNPSRDFLFRAEVDAGTRPPAVAPPGRSAGEGEVRLQWDNAVDDGGHVRRCVVCGCREVFVRKDFPQGVGLMIVAAAVVASIVLFAMQQIWWSLGTLAAVAGVDLVVYGFTKKCVVCYRCRSEFRGVPIAKDQGGWDLSIGEKYRQLAPPASANPGPAEQP